MTEIPTFATFYEYRGERLLRRSGGGDYQRVQVDGELTLARFPEALEFSSDPDDPWVMLPTWSFDAWYQQTVRGRWHGVPVEVVSLVKRGLDRGLVNLDYVGVRPDEAVSAGMRGDQYFGWSATVPPTEVEDITVKLTKLAISERYSRRGNRTQDRPSSALLTEAIVAFVGRGTRKIPTADEAAVFALDPQRFDEVITSVKAALRESDSIVVGESDRSDVNAAVIAKHRELLPDLDDRAIDALVWRWGYITFHG